jgi:Cu-Zn family superoxide dismutase
MLRITGKKTLAALCFVTSLGMIGCEKKEDEGAGGTTAATATATAAKTTAAQTTKEGDEGAADEEGPKAAYTVLKDAEGEELGTVKFMKIDEGIKVSAKLEGLSEGKHGFHVHENGKCEAPDFKSAGGHFAPNKSPHGAPDHDPPKRHTGDLGNVEANADGVATYERIDKVLAFSGTNNILGKAVILHKGTDDLKSQPSGAAGPRRACGVIQKGMPAE